MYIYTATDEITCFSENAITKGGGVPYRFCSFSILGYRFLGGPLSIFEGSLSRFNVQGNFLLLCSSTSFVGYSCARIRYLCVFVRDTKHPNMVRAPLGQFLEILKGCNRLIYSIQGGPLPVLNGVIALINGQKKMRNCGYFTLFIKVISPHL